MRMAWPGDMGFTRFATESTVFRVCLLASGGCAHHRADQYAYAPPYAPPVYSQPHVEMPTQPAVYAAAPSGMPVATVAAGAMPTGTVVGGPTMQGGVVPAVGGDCPPCSTPGMEGVVMPAAMVEGGGQTPPCPPGP